MPTGPKRWLTSIGRGNHSICTKDWRYIHYFDGSEELYDRCHDPHEWFNLADDPAHATVKDRLRRHIPADKQLRQFVRWGKWKCVFRTDGPPMLFDTHGTFGISEQNDIADQHPEVIAQITDYVNANAPTKRYVCVPDKNHPTADE